MSPEAAPMRAAALELRGVECMRGERTLFSRLDAAVAPGQLLRVRGANGAGKTSLLRIICGLALPARGEILWLGQGLARLREEFNRQMIYLGHAAALKGDLTAVENLQASSALTGRPCTDREAAAALGQAGLRGRERLPTRALSQGQRRRAALARLALGQSAPLWVLDEPLNTLDSSATAWLQGLIATHLGRGGVVVLTSHQDFAIEGGASQVTIAL